MSDRLCGGSMLYFISWQGNGYYKCNLSLLKSLTDNFTAITGTHTLLLQALTLADMCLVKYHKDKWCLEHALRCYYDCCYVFYSFSEVIYCKRKNKEFQGSSFQFVYESVFQSILHFSYILLDCSLINTSPSNTGSTLA